MQTSKPVDFKSGSPSTKMAPVPPKGPDMSSGKVPMAQNPMKIQMSGVVKGGEMKAGK